MSILEEEQAQHPQACLPWPVCRLSTARLYPCVLVPLSRLMRFLICGNHDGFMCGQDISSKVRVSVGGGTHSNVNVADARHRPKNNCPPGLFHPLRAMSWSAERRVQPFYVSARVVRRRFAAMSGTLESLSRQSVAIFFQPRIARPVSRNFTLKGEHVLSKGSKCLSVRLSLVK